MNILNDGFCSLAREDVFEHIPKGRLNMFHDEGEVTYWEQSLDNAQNSLRFISSPLTSIDVLVSSSIFKAAYFFFCSKRSRWKTLSRSISSNLYLSLTCFLNSLDILMASLKSVTFVFTKTESVSPYTT